MKETQLISVGLDIGTCTTKFVLSEITIAARGPSFTISQDAIAARKLLYASPMYRTPLTDHVTIDAMALSELLEAELGHAGVGLADIGSGAVIMTGETATKTNTEALLHKLAEQAGAFVVATAGSDLEAIMAGKGSGAAERSLRLHNTVANMDIGGGTANVAWFRNGIPMATVTFHMGGSLIRLKTDGTVTYVSPAIHDWLVMNRLAIAPDQIADSSVIHQLTRQMARTVGHFLASGNHDQAATNGAKLLVLGELPTQIPQADEWMLSGGIAALATGASVTTMAEISQYGDIGPALAQAIQETFTELGFTLVKAAQTHRATVIGAGLQSMELSGSTVHADAGTLPMRNVPIVQLQLHLEADTCPEQLNQLFESATRLYGKVEKAPFAIALSSPYAFTYKRLQELANHLIPLITRYLAAEQTAVILCDQDIAKALGQLLSLGCQGKPRIVCVDGIHPSFGDYIDLGELIANRTIPVIVKTLVFPKESHEVSP
ncbi:hypothetical protein A8709_08780 [Paenibacillus pectinilyticus]|uniref:Ethanolamine utilization protein n=1 Tax=Paenibacillus pectinilyticus TaxID=512399 RepID=A0A1C1A811_9BACL|nr:ethanolamine ammonia-lyase reactivating factor EutA [Paenibacillus pectinilyticus]OCT16746.1 hypothetical protein A8709_08780 [Paenibacillus pectinilyticus]